MSNRKIELNKNELEDMYINQNLTANKISKILNCDRKTVVKRLEELNIHKEHLKKDQKINPKSHSFLSEYAFSQLQIDLIIGSILGDGHISPKYNKTGRYSLQIRHCEKQKEYCKGKFDILKDICLKPDLKYFKQEDFVYYNFTTRRISPMKKYKEMGVSEVLHMLNENSLTIWLLDDGNLKDNAYRLSCKRFSKENLLILISILKNRFNIDANIDWENKEKTIYKGIKFNRENSEKLMKIIKQSDFNYLAKETMNYKLIGC